MGQVVLYIGLCLLLPIALLCFYLERRARRIMLSVAFGVTAGLLSYIINTWLKGALGVNSVYYATTFGPMVEEILKCIPIILVVFLLRKGMRGCVSNAFSVGVGFCIVENFFYLFKDIDSANVAWIVVRCVGTGLMHSMSGVILCLGIYYAREDKRVRLIGVIVSLFTAFMYHGLYNLLVNSQQVMVLGAVLPIITFLLILVVMKSGKYRNVFLGTLTSEIKKIEKKE